MDVLLERTWDAGDVEADLRTALDIVQRLDPPDDLRLSVFNMAAQLVAQRAMRQQVGNVHLPSMTQLQ